MCTVYECFKLSVDAKVAHIQLCRPEKRNSMIVSFWAELYAIIDKLDREARVRAIVISSTGPHFTSGMDLSVFQSLTPDASSSHTEKSVEIRDGGTTKAAVFYNTVSRLQRTFSRLEECRIPVLVAVQGGCIGAGLDMITACDCRYATSDAYFTIFETKLAMTADVGTFPRICKLMSDGLVRELAYTGRALSAQEALEAGLVNRLYDSQEELLEAVLEVAASISKNAPMAVYGCKKMILHARDHAVNDTLDHVGIWNAGFFSREELLEAMSAQEQQRSPQFQALPELPRDDDAHVGIEI
ncbi:MAG: enoyl-CoA hydratase-related protein [Granulosicoccus sp.]